METVNLYTTDDTYNSEWYVEVRYVSFFKYFNIHTNTWETMKYS